MANYYENPFENRNWEMHNIGRRNIFSHLRLCIGELKVKILEELVLKDPDNINLKEMLNIFRNEFEDDYQNSYFTD